MITIMTTFDPSPLGNRLGNFSSTIGFRKNIVKFKVRSCHTTTNNVNCYFFFSF